ncbi:uncharacterized protein LOC130647144 [Hydractinia symbiolongicarpus]|uniref:uncharacterized protein LOC130647144 n=1 Tax=Hydractinia symbiolongicarpus TaxID=13093 RepID=UPI00254E56C7|nr:uncharacterized protein LOC130647144 [Hydractinia symbiolongicarpus]XP_057308885.1 uncharacterized protein LOC130647144 [Hydractinia symbiolongicarpus]
MMNNLKYGIVIALWHIMLKVQGGTLKVFTPQYDIKKQVKIAWEISHPPKGRLKSFGVYIRPTMHKIVFYESNQLGPYLTKNAVAFIGRESKFTKSGKQFSLSTLVQEKALMFYAQAIFVDDVNNEKAANVVIYNLEEYDEYMKKQMKTTTRAPFFSEVEKKEDRAKDKATTSNKSIITAASISVILFTVALVIVLIMVKKKQKRIRKSTHVLHETIKKNKEDFEYTDIDPKHVKESLYTSLKRKEPWVTWPRLQLVEIENEDIYEELKFSDKKKKPDQDGDSDYVIVEDESFCNPVISAVPKISSEGEIGNNMVEENVTRKSNCENKGELSESMNDEVGGKNKEDTNTGEDYLEDIYESKHTYLDLLE